ncbi:MAG: helix-turn-helix transcriptional regulator [Desulfococcaceae bacterium]
MKNHDNRRLFRLMQILVEIKTTPAQPLARLLKTLGISKSQFYKDKQLLEEMGFEFTFQRKAGQFTILRDATLPIETLTLTEQLSLIMALRQLSATGDYLLTFEGFKAARKLAAGLPGPLRDALFEEVVLREGFGCARNVLETLQRAIGENRRVEILYHRPANSEAQIHRVDPYHIFFRRRALYMEGYSWTENGIRMYRLNRVKEVQLGERGFAIREGYDFGRRHKNAFSVFAGESTQTVVVRFSPPVRRFIEEALWHHSQQIAEESGGGIRFSVEVAEPREVMWWSFFWGDGAEILSPEWLRAEARETVERMARRYVNNPGNGELR